MRTLRNIVSIETLKLFYNAIAQPHFDYSHIVYDSVSKTNKDRLQKLQRRACRLITGSGSSISRILMFHELSWLFLQYTHDFHKLVMVYKCRNGLASQYLCDTFNANHDIHNKNTRNALLRVTKHAKARTAYYQSSFALSGQTLWNDLPNNIKLCTSLSSFKNALYKCLIAKPQF